MPLEEYMLTASLLLLSLLTKLSQAKLIMRKIEGVQEDRTLLLFEVTRNLGGIDFESAAAEACTVGIYQSVSNSDIRFSTEPGLHRKLKESQKPCSIQKRLPYDRPYRTNGTRDCVISIALVPVVKMSYFAGYCIRE